MWSFLTVRLKCDYDFATLLFLKKVKKIYKYIKIKQMPFKLHIVYPYYNSLQQHLGQHVKCLGNVQDDMKFQPIFI